MTLASVRKTSCLSGTYFRIIVRWSRLEDCQKSLGIKVEINVESRNLQAKKYKELTDRVLELYPNIQKVTITLRKSHSANYNDWSALLNNGNEFYCFQEI